MGSRDPPGIDDVGQRRGLRVNQDRLSRGRHGRHPTEGRPSDEHDGAGREPLRRDRARCEPERPSVILGPDERARIVTVENDHAGLVRDVIGRGDGLPSVRVAGRCGRGTVGTTTRPVPAASAPSDGDHDEQCHGDSISHGRKAAAGESDEHR